MHVFLIAAITIDGFIAQSKSQRSTSWTSVEDKQFFSQRTKQAGVVVMGNATFETIGKALPGRLNIVYSRTRSDESISDALRFTKKPPRELLFELAAQGYQEVAVCGGASIYTMFLKAGVIDTLYLTVEPVIFGAGVQLFDQELETSPRFSLESHKQIGSSSILLTYAAKGKK